MNLLLNISKHLALIYLKVNFNLQCIKTMGTDMESITNRCTEPTENAVIKNLNGHFLLDSRDNEVSVQRANVTLVRHA